VGHTGAGKTSFIGLILRLYEFQKGEILIDGVDIRTLDRKRLRASFGIIQQDVFLFAGTLKDNIELWKEGEIEVVKDLAPSFRKNFERILEGSESIKVGERGATLSFGERQVVAFTRALVKKPSVWILDEATSNIDTKAEQEIESEIDRLSRGRTRLVIAHRLSTIRDAHKIIVLEKGHLVEQGTHDELSVRDGVYEKLLKYEIAHKSELTV
jgi:ATP-binding cassette subfamily B protein